MQPEPHLAVPDAATLAGLRTALRQAGYSDKAVADALGPRCGVQALLAARHAEDVVATDVNERALAFTRINAALNEIENVEPRRGDLFEPFRQETRTP